MKSSNIFIRIFLALAFFASPAFVAQAENIITPEKVYDLAFSNCGELELALKTQAPVISTFDKLKLAENLAKIITLKAPSNSQFPNSSSAPFNAKAFDVSLTLNPNSENKAKECAINNLSTLLPESTISIPSLITASKDTSLPRFLKVLMLEKAQALSKAIREPLKDYILSAFANEFKTNKQVLNEDVLVPALLPIVAKQLDFFRSQSLIYESVPIATAIKIGNPSADTEVSALIKELLSAHPSATKHFILRMLARYPEQVPIVLEALPALLSSLTSVETNALIDLLSKFADSHLTYFPDYVSDPVAESLLHLLTVTSPKQESSLAKTARELNLNSKSKLCKDSTLGKDQSNLIESQQIYLASLCSLKNSSVEILKPLSKQKSVENLVLSLVLISKNESLRSLNLIDAYKELEKLRPSISPKEFRDTGYYILALENQNLTSALKPSLIKLAEELISEEPSYPSILGNVLINWGHPSSYYFTSLGRQAIKPVSNLLRSNKSTFLKRQGLSIFASNTFVAHAELIPFVENLIADVDLDIRRVAYQVLSKRAEVYPSPSKNKAGKNIYSQFYDSRLRLQFLPKDRIKDRQVASLDLFNSFGNLKCQEASVPLKFISKEDLVALPSQVKEQVEEQLVECLKDKGPFGKRAISTLELLSPLSEIGRKKLEDILIHEKFSQLSAKDGIKYLSMLGPSGSADKLPKQIKSNFYGGLSLKDQAIYADWLTSTPGDGVGIEQLFSEYFDDSIREVVLNLKEHKQSETKTEKETSDEIDKLSEILNKNGKELLPLVRRLPETTKIEIINFVDSQSDPRLSLEIKGQLCPYLPFKNCKFAIKPSLENTLDNPAGTLSEIALLLDRNVADSEEDKLLISSAIEERITALIQQGNMQLLIGTKLIPQYVAILEKISSNSQDSSLALIARYIRNSMAPIE